MVISRAAFAGVLLLNSSLALAVDFGNLKSMSDMSNHSVLENVNKSLADQQVRMDSSNSRWARPNSLRAMTSASKGC